MHGGPTDRPDLVGCGFGRLGVEVCPSVAASPQGSQGLRARRKVWSLPLVLVLPCGLSAARHRPPTLWPHAPAICLLRRSPRCRKPCRTNRLTGATRFAGPDPWPGRCSCSPNLPRPAGLSAVSIARELACKAPLGKPDGSWLSLAARRTCPAGGWGTVAVRSICRGTSGMLGEEGAKFANLESQAGWPRCPTSPGRLGT